MKRLLNIITLLFLIVLLNLPSIGHTAGMICAEWGRFAHCSICYPDTDCAGAAGPYWYCMTWTSYYSDGSSWTRCTWCNYCSPPWCEAWQESLEHWYFAQGTDMDGDGHQAIGSCPQGDDCDDNDPSVYPGAPEICGDCKDNNCNGKIDEDCCPEIEDFKGRSKGGTLLIKLTYNNTVYSINEFKNDGD